MTDKERSLLVEILRMHVPDLANRIQAEGVRKITREDALRILDALGWDFCENGLEENDEPNERGRLVDNLIGVFSLIAQRT